MGGRSRAELPGAGERGDKGSLQGMRGGERFYSQGQRPSQVFPYKEESAGYSGGWYPKALCQYLIGPGCRGSVPGSLASLRNLSVAFFWGMPQNARPFNQAPRKATHCLRRKVGQNIKDKKRETKELGTESHPGKGVLIEEVSNHQETLTLAGLGEVFKSQRAT